MSKNITVKRAILLPLIFRTLHLLEFN